MKVAFTEARLAALKPPAAGRVYLYDAKTSGLAVCVTAKGRKTFYLYRRIGGRPVRVLIGRYPALAVEQARREARKMLGQIAQGLDPQARKRAARGEMTFGALFADFLERHAKPHKRSWQADQEQYDRYLKPLAGRKVSALTQADVQRLHAHIGKDHGPYSANRALALVSAMYGRCASNLPNPAKGIHRFKEQTRDRFLDAEELRRFFTALEAEPSETWRDFFTVALLTGARRANVLAMRWADLNLDRGLWRIPETESKNREPLVCILVDPVVSILRGRAEGRNGSPYVFPSVGKSGHLQEPKKAWHALLERAGLLDADGKNTVRIHDLRRTLGSWQAGAGASLSIIGRTLGHKNVATTAIYARLDLDPVRASVETATRAILKAGKAKPLALLPAAKPKTKSSAERTHNPKAVTG